MALNSSPISYSANALYRHHPMCAYRAQFGYSNGCVLFVIKGLTASMHVPAGLSHQYIIFLLSKIKLLRLWRGAN